MAGVKKEVELTFTTKERRKVEVTFPIYRKHDLLPDRGDSVIYERISADMKSVSVHISNSYDGRVQYELEFEERKSLSGSSADYALGLGEYASTEAEFLAALEEMKVALSKV